MSTFAPLNVPRDFYSWFPDVRLASIYLTLASMAEPVSGQLLTTVGALYVLRNWGGSWQRKVRREIRRLRDLGFIEVKSLDSRRRLITVVDFEKVFPQEVLADTEPYMSPRWRLNAP